MNMYDVISCVEMRLYDVQRYRQGEKQKLEKSGNNVQCIEPQGDQLSED